MDSRRAAPMPEPEAVTATPLFSALVSPLSASGGGRVLGGVGMALGGTAGCSDCAGSRFVDVGRELKGLWLPGEDVALPLLPRSGR